MSIFKCKMCGGTIEFEQGATVGVCDSCGTKQTLPRLDDDRKANLYDRANHFRRNNDFDKAMGIYETILNEDNTDAEAYWSLVLCRYGIEYVEDPDTHKRIPTVNRAQYTSIFMDEDYKSALKYADGYQKKIYEQEAKAIDEIQKGILEISRKEEPFDCFISFKETDANGRRTRDAVLAQDLYNELTKEGFKVFFAPVTLEDKLGTAYEPYIFAALNSSKVMVVLGTKPENFNAVWVKNEWSRYLALIKNGAKKTLIPAYRDMDPYDLPEEFSHLMAQDMSKLGFMQDLIRGIKKLLAADEPKAAVKETVVVNGGGAAVEPLLKRAFMFLEDGNWEDADEYCEKVLDQEPENAQAYLGKLMAECRVRKQSQLKDCPKPFDGSSNFKKAVRFGDEQLSTELNGYIAHINERNELNRKIEIYSRALNDMASAVTEDDFKAAANKFASIRGFKDADEKRQQCLEKAEDSRKNAVYDTAIKDMSVDTIKYYEDAIGRFESIRGWRDAEQKIVECRDRIAGIKKQEEAKRIAAEKAAKKTKKILSIAIPAVFAVVALVLVLTKVIIPNSKYNAALKLIDDGNVVEAYDSLMAMGGYKDSAEKAASIYDQYKMEKIKLAEVGDTVYFGNYEQDNDTSNGKEKIEWQVLAKENNKVLVISKYALDSQRYNTADEGVTWETCTLRTWLNGTFLDNAFSSSEQAAIAQTTVTADKNPKYDTDPGNATTDKVFLLSIDEANKYFSSDSARQCKPTAFTLANGVRYEKDGELVHYWRLRSPGGAQDYTAVVSYDGSAGASFGFRVDIGGDAIRPALWIDLGS